MSFSGVLVFGGVLDLRDPFLVVDGVLVIGQFWSGGVLDISQGVPQKYFFFGTGGQNLSVVGRKGYGENFLLVSLE